MKRALAKFFPEVSVIVTLLFCSCATSKLRPISEQSLLLLDQGTLNLRQGDLEGAEAAFRLAIELGHVPGGLDGLGCVALLHGSYNEAEYYFLKTLEVDPSYSSVLGNLGLLYDLMGEEEKARRYYEDALEKNPLHLKNRGNYGAFSHGVGDNLNAEHSFQELRQLVGKNTSDAGLIRRVILGENKRERNQYGK